MPTLRKRVGGGSVRSSDSITSYAYPPPPPPSSSDDDDDDSQHQQKKRSAATARARLVPSVVRGRNLQPRRTAQPAFGYDETIGTLKKDGAAVVEAQQKVERSMSPQLGRDSSPAAHVFEDSSTGSSSDGFNNNSNSVISFGRSVGDTFNLSMNNSILFGADDDDDDDDYDGMLIDNAGADAKGKGNDGSFSPSGLVSQRTKNNIKNNNGKDVATGSRYTAYTSSCFGSHTFDSSQEITGASAEAQAIDETEATM